MFKIKDRKMTEDAKQVRFSLDIIEGNTFKNK
jgi:hypothetical protein